MGVRPEASVPAGMMKTVEADDWRAKARGETPLQRADRNFQELLAELRVLQTGVQILFGFLLIFAVQPRFEQISAFSKVIYLATLVLCCVATAFLMAPVAYHRTLFARGMKPEIVQSSDRLAHGGIAALFLAIISALLLILDLVIDSRAIAAVLTGCVAVVFASLWYVLPHRLRRRGGRAGKLGPSNSAADSPPQ